MMQNGFFKKTVTTAIVAVLAVCLLGCGMMYFSQENMIFYPEALPPDFKYSFPARFEEVNLPVAGATINALYFRTERPRGVVVYFHGNAGSLRGWGEVATDFTGKGYDTFIPDYRGFGKSTGRIKNETMLHGDAAAVYAYVRKTFEEDRIILYGRSIGTGIAVKLAKTNRPQMVILESPYVSFLDLAAHHYPLIPRPLLGLLLRYTLRTDLWIPEVACPVYLIHGTLDEIIPYDSSERLLKLIKSDGRLIAVPGGGHNNLADFPLYHEQLAGILKKTPQARIP
jgi:pimeloyl-ACP methyl ester carboxylesterase